ncbi:hypothetical protein ACM7HV_26860 [Pseudomonas paraeruginosa]|uniref:Uncharacterized protein n=1 Tax=Pseudomonas aeruginosa TaxID=287 RepID=A0ABD7JX78_PSEAI|nr:MULTISPECIES: hypothetical protein [Pseudomonas aeruginosa group]KFF32173.1 hypothetical protein G039_0331475 [Pseudomonas aeruginosa VRFPA01]KFF33007.1 hypothetical protein G039_0326815 [Pseudomonas aeruginosa VRFPA01]RTR93283.1 hypothetical protein DY932_24200 [Pseudomonas paraeruginosa]RTS42289.1 hypothetical protein DY940_23790 [Pseudomonas aeruginosa]
MLPRIDLQAMERVARDMANQELSKYLCSTMDAVLPRIPTIPQYVPHLVAMAGELACAAGYDQGRTYSIYVMICFLLGPGWEHDPGNRRVTQALADPGTDIDARLNLALNQAIQQRKRLETRLPQMLARIEQMLAREDTALMETVWDDFRKWARSWHGIAEEDQVLDLFEIYETGAFQLHRRKPPQRKRLTASDRQTYARINWPLPQPADPYREFAPQVSLMIGRLVLLAMAYGRTFYRNPLLQPLHQILVETPTSPLQTTALQAFIRQHRHALTEHPHGR